MKGKTGVKNRRLLFAKNSILMLVMLVVIFLAIFAWYGIRKQVGATGISVEAAKPGDVQIAVPNSSDKLPTDGDFKNSIDFKNETNYFMDFIKDVTSDGHQFVVPTFDTTDPDSTATNGKTVLMAGDWTEGLSSRAALISPDESDDNKYNYISLDFYLRSSSPRISLSSESYLQAYSEQQTGTNAKISSGTFNKGTNIPFSADAIVGAMRVSLEKSAVTFSGGEEEDNTSLRERTLLWLPRPDIHVNTASDESNWSLNYVKPTDALASTTYRHTFYEGDYVPNTTVKRGLIEHTYYDSGATPSLSSGAASPDFFKVTKIPSSEYNSIGTAGYTPKFGQTVQIASDADALTPATTNYSKSWYIYRMRLNVWIEGADAEARRAMNNGKFKLFLEFR